MIWTTGNTNTKSRQQRNATQRFWDSNKGQCNTLSLFAAVYCGESSKASFNIQLSILRSIRDWDSIDAILQASLNNPTYFKQDGKTEKRAALSMNALHLFNSNPTKVLIYFCPLWYEPLQRPRSSYASDNVGRLKLFWRVIPVLIIRMERNFNWFNWKYLHQLPCSFIERPGRARKIGVFRLERAFIPWFWTAC